MRWKEIDEAPLADFAVQGDLDKYGSFREPDLKAMRNPKWIEKVHNIFSKTPFDFNVYVNNVPHGMLHMDGNDYDVRKLWDVSRFHGLVPFDQIKPFIGDADPKREQAITVLLTNNLGDEIVPMTPWILAHRVAHAILYADRSPERHRSTDLTSQINQFRQDFQFVFDSLRSFGLGVGRDLEATAKQIGKFGSARNGKVRDAGEFMVESLTQYLVQGSITFKRLDVPEAEVVPTLLAKARAHYSDGARPNSGEAFAKRVLRAPKRPEHPGFIAFADDGTGIASGMSNPEREKQYADRGLRVEQRPGSTPEQFAKYRAYQERLKALAAQYDAWRGDGSLRTPTNGHERATRVNALLAKAEDNINETVRRILIRCLGKAFIL